ncbi:MAG TPA: AbrB/MazE/SpoVT family DNA-binding domain-containing protein [Candidatus Dormibacteraeota bacterium]|nr:AbrB/MazE/SpoVT family DNA-binding domain-containing protein [Candidatus Dormibacteraeota bacterium]
MKTALTNTNDKGQIVIPKEIRDSLAINSKVTLSVTQTGNGIYIYPVEDFIIKTTGESSYSHLLAKTKGTWDNEDWDSTRAQKSKAELSASQDRKSSW